MGVVMPPLLSTTSSCPVGLNAAALTKSPCCCVCSGGVRHHVAIQSSRLAPKPIWNTPTTTPIGAPFPTGCQTRDSLVDDTTVASMNGNRTGDPRYVDAVNSDLHIMTDSAAKNVANVDHAPALDIDGKRRDAAPDIGADEFE